MYLMAGDRVRLTEPIERYPLTIVPTGELGTITGSNKEVVRLKLDRYTEGLDDWDNCLEFYPTNNPEHCLELLFSLEKL